MSASPLFRATERVVRTNSTRAAEGITRTNRAAQRVVRANSHRAAKHVAPTNRVFESVVRTSSARAAERITSTGSFRAAERVVRGHSRTSMIAASAAAAAVLGTAGFAVGAAPWAEAAGHATTVAEVTSHTAHPAPSRPGSFLFNSISGTKSADGKTVGGINLDVLHAAAAAADKAPGHPAPTVPAAPGSHAVTKPAVTPSTAAKAAVTKPVVKPRVTKPKAPAGPTAPYLFYDSVKPGSLPAGRPAAVYATGHYAAQASSVAGRHVLWIDTQGGDPAANVLDVEPGDATPAEAAQWVHARLSGNPHAIAIVYTMRAEWQEVKNQMATLPGWMHTKVRYWIADPTGYAHVVPGSSATQWYWGNEYDISTANPDFEQ